MAPNGAVYTGPPGRTPSEPEGSKRSLPMGTPPCAAPVGIGT